MKEPINGPYISEREKTLTRRRENRQAHRSKAFKLNRIGDFLITLGALGGVESVLSTLVGWQGINLADPGDLVILGFDALCIMGCIGGILLKLAARRKYPRLPKNDHY